MKKIITLTAAVVALATFNLQLATVHAATPAYVTKSGNSIGGTNGAKVIFPSDPSLQIRVVSLNWNSDSNTAVASFNTGAGAYTITATNLSSTYLTQYVNTTIGMVTNTTFILEHAGVGYSQLLTGTNNLTNAVFLSGAFGVISSVNDNLYQLDTAITIPIGATTNAQNGDALYVGNYARPVIVQITPVLTTNKINSAVVRYE